MMSNASCCTVACQTALSQPANSCAALGLALQGEKVEANARFLTTAEW